MTRYFTMHADNPQRRLILQVVEVLRAKALIIYPTDSFYAFGCSLESRSGVETIRTLRKLQPKHPLSLICADMRQASKYCLINDSAFRYVKKLTPGSYTFILPATKQVPKYAQGSKHKEVGIRIPDHPISRDIVMELGSPIISSTLKLPMLDDPVNEPSLIPPHILSFVELVIESGLSPGHSSTLVDLLSDAPKILRNGDGDLDPFEV